MQIIEVFQTQPVVFNIVMLITGLMVGSFLNVVIYRYPLMLFREWKEECFEMLEEFGYKVTGESNDPRLVDDNFNLVVPRSHCRKCKKLIRFWENIPLISYLFQRGKCTQCGTPISLRYPFVELLTGIAYCWIATQFGFSWLTLIYLVVISIFIVHFFIDIDHQILPDPFTYIVLWLGLGAATFGLTIPLQDAVIGALVGYLSLWTLNALFKLLRKKDGMGAGDFKLFAAIGAFVGWQFLPLVLLMSSVVGAVLGIIMLRLQSKGLETRISFGPYLATAGWVTMFWGDTILQYIR
ncbi:A24 family peptidase [Pleionea sp. CnH1-48]|uniref:prepilin peptidase n=1 Tax=Pleionea sp. CnH1-48 TaxID=2954494 RepID=UPI002097FACE|nr:A24 family peptidase [Pleionea sp. CnH1-48]MCO7223978.1 A24 family peptidase [Pleionea sp. CnH1-48]